MTKFEIDPRPLLVAAALLLFSNDASAHIVLAEHEAKAGSYYQATFDVPHGCAGSATTGISVEIPADIVTAKPQPKPGWTLTITREDLAVPVASESGAMLKQRTKTISWTGGKLLDEDFDAFAMMVHLPSRTGPLYFPVVQTCESGKTLWTEVPPPGKTAHDVPHPPPYVVLLPAAGE